MTTKLKYQSFCILVVYGFYLKYLYHWNVTIVGGLLYWNIQNGLKAIFRCTNVLHIFCCIPLYCHSTNTHQDSYWRISKIFSKFCLCQQNIKSRLELFCIYLPKVHSLWRFLLCRPLRICNRIEWSGNVMQKKITVYFQLGTTSTTQNFTKKIKKIFCMNVNKNAPLQG